MKNRDKGQETNSRIIDAAMDVFSEVGFNGARVDDIAERAGVNKATLYYHIGDKMALYTSVLHNVISYSAELIGQEIASAPSPEEKLRIYIRGFAHAVEKNPRMAPIMLRELASGGQSLPGVVARDMARIIGVITAILEEGYEQDSFIKVTPFILHMMVAGTIVLYRTTAPIRASQPDIDEAVKSLDLNVSERVVNEIERLVLNAVLKKA
ncbi:MAG: TetR/AcrR family transcriptional regulator [Syntrophales bacterium]|nr:TetR/AcrR family transcriptional regulator [Syntrophales bacterium]